MAEIPCVICEKYMKGVLCDDADCTVAKLKKELARHKRQNKLIVIYTVLCIGVAVVILRMCLR